MQLRSYARSVGGAANLNTSIHFFVQNRNMHFSFVLVYVVGYRAVQSMFNILVGKWTRKSMLIERWDERRVIISVTIHWHQYARARLSCVWLYCSFRSIPWCTLATHCLSLADWKCHSAMLAHTGMVIGVKRSRLQRVASFSRRDDTDDAVSISELPIKMAVQFELLLVRADSSTDEKYYLYTGHAYMERRGRRFARLRGTHRNRWTCCARFHWPFVRAAVLASIQCTAAEVCVWVCVCEATARVQTWIDELMLYRLCIKLEALLRPKGESA